MAHIYVLLPAFDEARSLPILFDTISQELNDYEIVLVDDGSVDETKEVANSYLSKLPLTILHHKFNKGLGAALRTGLTHIAEFGNEGSIVVTMDSDLTHEPSFIPLLESEIHNGYDIAVASRYAQGGAQHNLPFSRRFLSWGLNILIRLSGSSVKDNSSGFRCMKLETLQKAVHTYGQDFITTNGFPATVEILQKLRHVGAKIKEVPVQLDYGRKLGSSKLKLGEAIPLYLKFLFRIRKYLIHTRGYRHQ
jgi:dolichol-phosphate mannosyltransferase